MSAAPLINKSRLVRVIITHNRARHRIECSRVAPRAAAEHSVQHTPVVVRIAVTIAYASLAMFVCCCIRLVFGALVSCVCGHTVSRCPSCILAVLVQQLAGKQATSMELHSPSESPSCPLHNGCCAIIACRYPAHLPHFFPLVGIGPCRWVGHLLCTGERPKPEGSDVL
jgi:hypothetical protein